MIDKDIRPITEEENNQYKVIIRRTTDFDYHRNYSDISVSFYPSDEVECLTNVVLKTMGTSLDEVKKRSFIYQSRDFSANGDIFYRTMPDNPLYYAALHVRGKDMYSILSYNKYWSNPRHLKHIINRVQSLFKGCRIYIMSDLHDRHYFDFPELEALVSKNNNCEIDNAMLYAVEKNILQYAYIKIVRAKNCIQMAYINSSFNVSLLSMLPKYLHRSYLYQPLSVILRKIPGIKRIKNLR